MDLQLRETERGYEANLRKLLGLVQLVLVRSRSIAERLIELDCDPQKIRLNRIGIPLDGFPYTVRSFPVDGEWTIVQACRLVPKKGLPTALCAFARFAKAFPKSRFLIAGEGPMRRELEELVQQLSLQKEAAFLGFLSQPDLRELYERAHVFVHPSELSQDSHQDGELNSMLEAMASGLPVVTTRHGGISEAVTDGLNGLLVAEGDDQGLAASLFRMVEDPVRWRAMGAAASETVAREFSQPRQIELLESAYFEAIEQWNKKSTEEKKGTE